VANLADYYHLRITRISNRSSDLLELDLPEDKLRKYIVEAYHKGEKFLCGGTIVDPFDIETIRINRTNEPSSSYLPKIRAELSSSNVIASIPEEWYVTEEGIDVTREFINFAPGRGSNKTNSPERQPGSLSYKIFVCYEDTTGLDLADQLKRSLGKRSIAAFVAKRDIPETVKNLETWRNIIDDAIKTCSTFVIILSIGYLTSEMRREFQLAVERSKREPEFAFVICHLSGVTRSSDQLAAMQVNLGDLQQVDFESKEELARKVNRVVDDQGRAKPITVTRGGVPQPDVILDTKDVKVNGIPWGNVSQMHKIESFNRDDHEIQLLDFNIRAEQIPEMRIGFSQRGPVQLPTEIKPHSYAIFDCYVDFSAKPGHQRPASIDVVATVEFAVSGKDGRETRSGTFRIRAP
jgi:hypothetical protein